MSLLALDAPLTDAGNAERIAHAYRDRLRHVQGLGWLRWAGTHWQIGHHHLHTDAAIYCARTLYAEATARVQADDQPTFHKAAQQWARKSESAASIAAALRLAADQDTLFATPKGLNAQPWLLNHAGGTVDLHTSATSPHRPADLLTVCAPANADNAGIHDGEHWHRFLRQVLPDDNLRAFVQRAVGQSLIGVQREHAWFMATGGGGNGKGTFFRALRAALGDYYAQLPANFFCQSDRERHPTELMNLLGRRLVVSAELPADKPLDETKLKELTGGDPVRAHYMGKDDVEFDPSHTVWVCCNRKPRVRATDQGFWRRANVVPFVVTIEPKDRDPDLDAKLAAERDAVLAWAVEGCAAYMRDGLGESALVTEATGEYRKDQDFFGQALAELCDINVGASVRKSTFREALKTYYAAAGVENVPTDIRVKAELEQRGIAEARVGADGWHWRGLELKPLVAANQRDQQRRDWTARY